MWFREKEKDGEVDLSSLVSEALGKEVSVEGQIDFDRKRIELLSELPSNALKFIKENLFNPHEGLWAETKLNTQFRENTTKWRGVIGVGFVALLVEKVWSMFTGG